MHPRGLILHGFGKKSTGVLGLTHETLPYGSAPSSGASLATRKPRS
jgi:hypothetical protein